MKRIWFLLLLSAFSCALIAQTGPIKKCSTCGLSIPKCQYKGKHPKSSTPSKASVKSASAKPVVQRPTLARPSNGIINGHSWVDLGLSVKWATCNVGAKNPSDYGGYYAWGETRPKSRYNWDNCFDCLDSKGYRWGTYKVDGQTQIAPNSGHDTARKNWGGTWRMPTAAELDELGSKCKWMWTNKGGHNGYIVTGPNGNSIFLPAAGRRIGNNSDWVGKHGEYWSYTITYDVSMYYNRYWPTHIRPTPATPVFCASMATTTPRTTTTVTSVEVFALLQSKEKEIPL